MGAARFLIRLLTAAAVAVAALVAAVAAAAGGGSGALSLAVSPTALVPGGSGAVTATFANTGNSTLTHVVVDITLAGGTFDASGSSAGCSATADGASCSLGNVGKGDTAVATVAFTSIAGDGPWTFDGTATWDAASVGKPHGAAASKDTTSASVTATLSLVPAGSTLLAVSSGCAANGDSVDASHGDEGISTQASEPPSGLDCTPITDGVVTDPNGGSDILFTKLPATPSPVNVTLTFADENLPFSGDHEQQPLIEYPNFPDLSTQVVVPFCTIGIESVESSSPIPEGFDSCIVSVNPNDPVDEDGDMGTVDLLVQSSGGDPGYH